MKKLLKKEVCGSREHCTGPTEQPTATKNHGSKKKKKGNADAKRAAFHQHPNGTLILFLVWYLILIKYFVNVLFLFFKQI